MKTFVDSSALVALVDEDDSRSSAAMDWLSGPGRDVEVDLVTHSYVVVETLAVVRSRLGPEATRVMIDAYLPALVTLFVDRHLHEAGLRSHLAAIRRKVSFVDWVSFEMMRSQGISLAFAFDRDFAAEGFELVP